MKIIVLNLTRDTKEGQLVKLFRAYGKIESCHIVLDEETGVSKGFGFVEIKNDSDGEKAIAALNGTNLGNNKIRVKVADLTVENVTKPKKKVKPQSDNPLHGIPLKDLLEKLVEVYGWERLSKLISINCFKNDPSIKSSLTFLRKTAWAREKVEELYIQKIVRKK